MTPYFLRGSLPTLQWMDTEALEVQAEYIVEMQEVSQLQSESSGVPTELGPGTTTQHQA